MGINFQKVNFAYYSPRKKDASFKYTISNINTQINFTDEFIAIVGHTGSGKSTLVQLMNALNLPTSGQIKIGENVITNKPKIKLKPIRQQIGLVFQFPEYQLFEETVLKDIMFGPRNFGQSEAEAKQRSLLAAEVVGVESELLERSPFSLSGGQMRRVAIAGILASNPDVLVLDEPTVGLDPKAKRELLLFLQKLHQEENKTIIIISHDMDVVAEFCSRVIVMKDGEIAFDGPKADLFRQDNLQDKYNLDYPEIMLIMQALRTRLGIDFDIHQYSVSDAYREIRAKLGDQ